MMCSHTLISTLYMWGGGGGEACTMMCSHLFMNTLNMLMHVHTQTCPVCNTLSFPHIPLSPSLSLPLLSSPSLTHSLSLPPSLPSLTDPPSLPPHSHSPSLPLPPSPSLSLPLSPYCLLTLKPYWLPLHFLHGCAGGDECVHHLRRHAL